MDGESILTEGNLRKDSSERFQVVYHMTLKNPEFIASKGNLGAVQRLFDNVTNNLPRVTTALVDQAKTVYYIDKNKKLVTTSGGFIQRIDDLAYNLCGYVILLGYKKEILNPLPPLPPPPTPGPQPGPNPPPQPGPNPPPTPGPNPLPPEPKPPPPKPSPASGKQDAIDYYNKRYQLEKERGSTGISWIEQVLGDAKAGLARYSLIQPPTNESRYFVEYFTTLYNLATNKKPEIQEDQKQKEEDQASEKAREEFWNTWKWWIIGGGVVGVTGIGIIKSL